MSSTLIKDLKNLKGRIAALEAAPTKMTKREKKEGAEPRVASAGVQAWKIKVEQTVADMRANGWESWTDIMGNVFAGSKPATIDGRATHVFADTGKEPAYPIGLKRTSYLKMKDSPEELAKTKVRFAARAAAVAARLERENKTELKKELAKAEELSFNPLSFHSFSI